MDYWRNVLTHRLPTLEKYLCGVCERGWVLHVVVQETGTSLWVCEECDSVWLNADQTRQKASPVSPDLVLQQIVGPAGGTLRDYVKPHGGATQPLTDWEQLKLAADIPPRDR